MHNDDVMVGRLLTRRELVALLGMSSVAAMAEPLAGQGPGTAIPAAWCSRNRRKARISSTRC